MDPKTRGIVAYLTIIGWIVAIATNNPKDEFASFHIRQMLGLIIISFISSAIMIIPFLGWIIGLAGTLLALVLWILALIGAANGETKPIPVLGQQFQEWFHSL